MSKVVLLTGGGSAGHVTPNIALFPGLRERGYELHYIGLDDGIEHKLIAEQQDVHFHSIEAGKLRRYFSLKNLTDSFKVIKGISQAKEIIRQIKPDLVFSKGGFVSVPVVMAAKGKCPILCHESDFTPGLANKIAARYADKILVTFEDTLKYTGSKGIHTGTPIRRELFSGNRIEGLKFLGFSGAKPIILVMGGSLGAAALNDAVRASLDTLAEEFDIVHLCGRGKVDDSIRCSAYRQYEYIGKELPDILAATTLVISRAGANALFEFLSLNKPALLVPLPKEASRGDQLLNAAYAERKGYSMVLFQEDITPERLVGDIDKLFRNRNGFIERMMQDSTLDGTDEVLACIDEMIV